MVNGHCDTPLFSEVSRGSLLAVMTRVLARLDLKGSDLINTVQMEGLRKVGSPREAAVSYYADGADEILLMDIVASLYKRNNLVSVVESITSDLFIPVTVGGGIRKLDDVKELLDSGADKVAINSGAVRRPELLGEVAEKYGSQCLVLSIEAKSAGPGVWEVYIDGGREATGLRVSDWVKTAEGFGVGEILVTSIDREGTKLGFDLELFEQVLQVSNGPVIISGGFGHFGHLNQPALRDASGIAFADCLHTNRIQISDIKAELCRRRFDVRLNY